MNASQNSRDRLMDLLADQALFGVTDSERMELRELLLDHPDVNQDDLERVATLVQLSEIGSEVPKLSESFEQSILDAVLKNKDKVESSTSNSESEPAGINEASSLQLPSTPPTHSRRGVVGYLLGVSGWVIAGTLMVAMAFPQLLTGPEPVQPTMAQVRDELISSNPEATLEWTKTEDQAAVNASGQIVWDNAAQKGFMTFKGLAANNPEEYQYQLWIFDGTQEHPVDGGVFDIADEGSETIIPVDAKIQVREPTLFAVTIERPGGVVVSKKERITVTAAPAP